MEDSRFWVLNSVSDAQLRSALTDLLGSGSRTEARIIAHLAEVEQRRLHLRDGSESLYAYCIHVLRLSNNEAFHRITAARLARRFPIGFTLLEQRALHLTAVCLLRDYLTAENHRELLSAATHKTKTQVEELIARRFPRPDVQSRIRKLPAPRAASRKPHPHESHPHESHTHKSHPHESHPHESHPHESHPHESHPHESHPHESHPHESAAPIVAGSPSHAVGSDVFALSSDTCAASPSRLAPSEPNNLAATARLSETTTLGELGACLLANPQFAEAPAKPPSMIGSRNPPQPRPIAPLSEARYRIQLNASAALKQKLDRLRELTSHSNPTGDLALAIERALDLAIEQAERQRFAKSQRPRRVDLERRVESSVPPHAETTSHAATSSPGRRTSERTHIANAVVREVVTRDEARCTFVGTDGCRCTARAFLQIHHEQSWARGGKDTPDNLRLLCASHNRLLAEQEFGIEYVAQRIRVRRVPRRVE